MIYTGKDFICKEKKIYIKIYKIHACRIQEEIWKVYRYSHKLKGLTHLNIRFELR